MSLLPTFGLNFTAYVQWGQPIAFTSKSQSLVFYIWHICHCIEKGVFVLKVWHLKKHSHEKSFFSILTNLALIDPQSLVSSIFHLLFHPRLVFHLLLWNLTEAHLLANLLGQKVDRVNHKHDWTWTKVNDDLVKSYCWKIIMSIEITDKWIWDKKRE